MTIENKKISEIFATRLREERIKKNLPIKCMAEKLNISYSAYIHYESKKSFRKPRLKTIVKIVNILNVRVDYLIGRIEEKL
jgi:transcriptional regulator with XRE-family HTH domain